MNARWRLRPHDPTRIQDLSRRSGLSPLVAHFSAQRKLSREDAEALRRLLQEHDDGK